MMARFFSEEEIDGFRDCFYLNSKSGIINDLDQLKFVMRSVGFSPTIEELETHLKQRSKLRSTTKLIEPFNDPMFSYGVHLLRVVATPITLRVLAKTFNTSHVPNNKLQLCLLTPNLTIDNSIKFADFLDCAHAQMQMDNIPDEILTAFKVSPFVRRDQNNIRLDTLRHLLCNFGEKFSHKEFNALTKELNINKPEISYSQFVNSLVPHRHKQTPNPSRGH